MCDLPYFVFSLAVVLRACGHADKKGAPVSGKPGGGAPTSLRFSSQPASYWPDNYGGQPGPDSPVKMSPVSERIKALEALAARKEADFRCDSFWNLKERQRDKWSSDAPNPAEEKTTSERSSPDGDSPETPAESRQPIELEETETWMKAHLPPAPDFGAVSPEPEPAHESPPLPARADVPNAPADPWRDASKRKESESAVGVEEPDFELNFLPTAHVWTRPDNSGARALPPAPLDSPPDECAPEAPGDETADDPEPAEVREADSSGESEETVVEDEPAPVVPSSRWDGPPPGADAPSPDPQEVSVPLRLERKLMQVPTINVIETEEPNRSDDEMEMELEEEDEDDEEPKSAQAAPEDADEPANRRPVETEFMEGYSPPSSPVQSEDEHPMLHSQAEAFPEKPVEHQDHKFDLPATSETASNFTKETDSPGNDDDGGSEEAQEEEEDRVDVAAWDASPDDKDEAFFSRNSFMREDTYEGRSFDDEQPPLPCETAPMAPMSDGFLSDSLEADAKPREAPPSRDHADDPRDDVAPQPIDSFVEFMRECLKTREGQEPDGDPRSPPSPPDVPTLPEEEAVAIGAPEELDDGRTANEKRPASRSEMPESGDPATFRRASPDGDPHAFSEEVDPADIWVAEAYHLAELVLMSVLTHDSVKDLIYWRDPKKSGLVFGLSMLVLLSLAAFSVISVVSYLLLALLCVTITFRIYKSVVQAVKKSDDGHPFKPLLEKDVSISAETFRKHVDASLTYINGALKQLSRLFLVEDLVDSLKLAVVMWLLTYVGAIFNGITILILVDILLFAIPPVYEKNKTQIDQYVDLARTRINTTVAKLQEKLPGAVKRSKSE
ncbi:reticulon-3 isoform X3 [Stigmatopora argus]